MLPLEQAHQALRAPTASGVDSRTQPEDPRLMEQAKKFESVFIAQMLNTAGLGKAVAQDSNYGGDAFSSFLVQEYADKIVDNGGFGLADKIYSQLLEKEAPDAKSQSV